MSSTSSSPWRIFVSSTKEDLIPYREAVETVLTGMEHIPLGMEYFVSSPDSPIDVCLATVRRSQLYIVIVGMRYGSIEEGSGKSFTELEYDEAVKNKIPVLAFIIDEEQCPVLPKFVDVGEKAEKLKQFKAKLNSSYLVSRFASIDNLKQLVEKSVRQAIDKISADKAEKNAAQSNEVALADYIAGAKLFRRFALLPQRYSGREVVLRIRMDGQFGTWKMRDEFFTALALTQAIHYLATTQLLLELIWTIWMKELELLTFLQEARMQIGFLIMKSRLGPFLKGNLNLHMSKLRVLSQEVMAILPQVLQR